MSQTVYVIYYGVINELKARALMTLCANIIAQQTPGQLYFLFSSGGSSVDAGVALYNYLRALPVPLVMHNTGSVDSIANIVFLAADERYANPNSSFLLHGITWESGQGANLSWIALQETMSRFKADGARMSQASSPLGPRYFRTSSLICIVRATRSACHLRRTKAWCKISVRPRFRLALRSYHVASLEDMMVLRLLSELTRACSPLAPPYTSL